LQILASGLFATWPIWVRLEAAMSICVWLTVTGVALLDADDHFHNARLATLLSLGEQADADMVADNLVQYNETDGSTRIPFGKSKFPTARFMSFQEFVESCYFGKARRSDRDTFSCIRWSKEHSSRVLNSVMIHCPVMVRISSSTSTVSRPVRTGLSHRRRCIRIVSMMGQ